MEIKIMKKIITLLLLVTSYCASFAQTTNPTPTKFTNGLVIPTNVTPPLAVEGSIWYQNNKFTYYDFSTSTWKNLLSEVQANLSYLKYTDTYVNTPIYNQFLSYDPFGDSITFGYNATIPDSNYVSRVGKSLGIIPVNHGVSGTQAAEQFDYIYPITVSSVSRQLFTYMVGTNDNWIYNTDVDKQANFNSFQKAAIAYLTIPKDNKIKAQESGITYASGWSNSTYYGGAISKQSTTNGNTASFSLYGNVIYIAYTIKDGNGGNFSVTVDGNVVGQYSNTGQNGALIATNLGRTYGSALLRIPNLSYTIHNVVITVTSPTSASNVVYLDWVGTNQGNNAVGGSTLIVGGVPRQKVNGVGPDSRTQYYTGLVKDNIALMANDGLNVSYADIPAYINPATDLISDNVHPNDLGFRHIANAFLSVINVSSRATNKEGARVANYLNNYISIHRPTGNIGFGQVFNTNNITPSYPYHFMNDIGAVFETKSLGNLSGDYTTVFKNSRRGGGGSTTNNINFDMGTNGGTTLTYGQIKSTVEANALGASSGNLYLRTLQNGALANRMSFYGNNIAIGSELTIPTARFHLPPGTATAGTSPFKLSSGLDNTTPESGSFEYNGGRLSFTPATVRKRVVLINDVAPANGQMIFGDGSNFGVATLGTSQGVTYTGVTGGGTIGLGDITPNRVNSTNDVTVGGNTRVTSAGVINNTAPLYFRGGSTTNGILVESDSLSIRPDGSGNWGLGTITHKFGTSYMIPPINSVGNYKLMVNNNSTNKIETVTPVANYGATVFIANDGTLKVGVDTTKIATPYSRKFIPNRVSLNNIDYYVLPSDYLICYVGIGAARTITLPSTVVANQVFEIKDESGLAGTNNLNVVVSGGGLIDGIASKVINSNYGGIRLYFNGTSYFTLPNNSNSVAVTSITPGIGFNSSTPITTSGTLNLDTVTTTSGIARKGFVTDRLAAKQNTLVSATNIKTINGSSILGSGDLVISGGTNYWNRTSNVLSTANANDLVTLSSNASGGTSVLYATGSSGTNGVTGQSDTQAGVIGRATGTTGIGGSFESALNTGFGGATIQVLSNGTGDIALFQSKISGVVTNQVYVRNNGLIEYIVDKSSLYGSRSVPDVAYVQSLTNKYPYLSKTANYTVLTTDWANTNTLTITVDASAGAVTITLPAASTTSGKIINIKKMDSSINSVTVNGGGTNIDGASTSLITMQYGNAMIQSISTQYITL